MHCWSFFTIKFFQDLIHFLIVRLVSYFESWKLNSLWRPFSISLSVQKCWRAFNSSRSWSLSSSFSKISFKSATKPTVFSLSTFDLSCDAVEVSNSLEFFSHTIHTLLTLRMTLSSSCLYGKLFLAGCMYNNYIPDRNNSSHTTLALSSGIGSTVYFPTVPAFQVSFLLSAGTWIKLGDLACTEIKLKYMVPKQMGDMKCPKKV